MLMVIYSLSKVNEVTVPTLVNTASLHRDKTMFVCGGEDLKMYKFDYNTGKEIGKCDDFEFQLSVLIYLCMNTFTFRVFQRSFWTCTLCPLLT